MCSGSNPTLHASEAATLIPSFLSLSFGGLETCVHDLLLDVGDQEKKLPGYVII